MNLLITEPTIPYLCECGVKYFAKRMKNCFGIFDGLGWIRYFCIEIITKFTIKANMATKIQQILESTLTSSLFFGELAHEAGALTPRNNIRI